MRYFQYVTFQAATPVRTGAGDVTYTYENVPALTDLPARVTAVTVEKEGERLTTVTDLFKIAVSGERPEIQTDMAVLDGDAVYNVLRVLPWALGRRGRRSTVVEAERVSI